CTKLLCGKPKSVMSGMMCSVANCPQNVMQCARDLRTSSRAKLGLWLQEWLIRFEESPCPRDADILQEVIVGAFGDLTQRAPLARTRDPAGDRVAPAPDQARRAILATVGNGPAGAERPAKGQDSHNRLRCGLRRPL